MIRCARKLEAARARIAELEADLGLVEQRRETHLEAYERELREQAAQLREQANNEARQEALCVIYVMGLVGWNVAAWMGGGTAKTVAPQWSHPWLIWVTSIWDLPAAIALAIGLVTFIGWLVTGRNALGRWL